MSDERDESNASNISKMGDADPVTDMADMTDMADAGDPSAGGEALRLDGNAAADVLAEVFGFEMTSAQGVCAHCGRTGPLGGMLLYGGVMGTVLRCTSCEQVQLRIVRVPGREGQARQYWIDLRGMRRLVITTAVPA